MHSHRSHTSKPKISMGQCGFIARQTDPLIDRACIEANLDRQKSRGSSNGHDSHSHASGPRRDRSSGGQN
jgi:hypothetical protein